MLAVLDSLRNRSEVVDAPEFVGASPPEGGIATEFSRRSIPHVPLKFYDLGGRRFPRADIEEQLLAAVAKYRPSVLHANSLAMGRLSGSLASRLNIPCLAHLRDIIRLSDAAVADLNRNRLLLAVSRATRDSHIAQGLQEQRLRVLYNGVDCRQFQPRPRTGSLCRELAIPEAAFLVLTIGQIGLRKGQDVLAKAAALAAASLPDVHYVLVGERLSAKPESVAYEQWVADAFQIAGLGNRLHRLGRRDDVPRLMNECDLLVHPAHQEPLGRVLLEAAASGLPVVATRVGGTPEIFDDERGARLVPPADPAALAAAMIQLYQDGRLRRQLADAARARVREAFPVDRAADALLSVWRTAATEETPPG